MCPQGIQKHEKGEETRPREKWAWKVSSRVSMMVVSDLSYFLVITGARWFA